MNYYRRYVGDYLRDTARLSMLEHGAYNLLLDYYYADEQPLPIDHQELYTMVRAMKPEDRKAIDKVLRMFFTQEPDGYHQKRVDHEIDVSKKARDNGKTGGRPRTGTITGLQTGALTEQRTGTITEEGGGSGHPPTTNHQPPAATHQPPASNQGQLLSDEPVARGRKNVNGEGKSVETWNAYSSAYQERYSVEPIRNAKVNGQFAKLVDQLGAEEAPKVAAFYLEHNGGLYVSSGHCVDLLLRDCAKLRTEMLTGRKITRLEARNLEQRDALREQSNRVGRILEGAKP